MTELFWIVPQETRIALMTYQWDHFKVKLNLPEEPKQEPHNPEYEPEVDPEIVREMEQKPHSPRYPA